MMRNPRIEPGTKGFSLIEVLVSTVVITIVLVGCLGCLAGLVEVHRRAWRLTELATEKWNDSRQFRDRADGGDEFRPAPGLPPLRRGVVGGDGSAEWEVLHHD
jgi:prepilin-type N-terminal cleavage/methylation domain-containing protein